MYTLADLRYKNDLDASRYYAMVSPSPFMNKIYTSAFNLAKINPNCQIWETGYPRNDQLTNTSAEEVRILKQKYNIPFAREAVEDIIFFITVGIIAGGRIGYALFYGGASFWEEPWKILAIWQGGLYATLPAVDPSVREAFDAILSCGQAMNEQVGANARFTLDMIQRGIPSGVDFVTSAPFDIFNDTLRGFLNVSMDMYDCPDELLTAVNAATRVQVRYIRNLIRTGTVKIVGFMLHNGFDSFMSKEQFETFYWPGLKASIDACIENDVIPWIYVEDSFMAKLDIIERDVPAHKVIFTFTGKNDLKAIKERFGGKYCLKGGLLASVIEYGSTEDVEKMVREAIDIYAPGGGLILDTDVALDNAKPENLRTLFDIAHNYIKY